MLRTFAYTFAAGALIASLSIPASQEPASSEGAPSNSADVPVPGQLHLPIPGISFLDLRDSYTDLRGAGRIHAAMDIMAPTGTPVLAVDAGTIVKLFHSKPGGLTIYQFNAGGELAYYYAHLDQYAEGLQEGDRVEPGTLIGYVGATGNADPTSPHLHFAIYRLGLERRWWDGTPVNPYPYFQPQEPLAP